MSKPAAIQGTYADYRRVKGRKVLQLVVEVPIEQAPEVHSIFGEPSPDGSTWVAVALLDPNAAKAPSTAPEKPASGGNGDGADRRKFTELRPSAQAALACERKAFRRWLATFPMADGPALIGTTDKDPSAVALADAFMKAQLGITSKTELDKESARGDDWRQFYGEFTGWLNDPEAP